MDLTAFARDTLATGGPNASALALAALQGDKDEIIRLLMAERRAEVPDSAALSTLRKALAKALTVGPMTTDDVLINDFQEVMKDLERAHRTRAAAEDRVTELEMENKTLREAIATEQARILELNGLVLSMKADYEQMREDFTATDNGWEELGKGMSKILGVSWDDLPNGNEDLLTAAREMRRDFDLVDVRWNELGHGISQLFGITWDELPNGNKDLLAALRKMKDDAAAQRAIFHATEAREYALRMEVERLRREEALRLDSIRAEARTAARAAAVGLSA